jgi:capsule polysaccharide export protein KpsE/RkpR
MSKSIELSQIIQMMLQTSNRINKATKTIYKLAENKAETERAYRMELAKEITKLRSEGVQATLIPDLARGHCEFFKCERDLAKDTYRAALSSLEALKVEASVLQTVSKYQDEI